MGARFSAPVQTGPGAHPAYCTMGTGSFPGVKSGRSVTLTPHPLLVPWSRKGRAIPLLPWAIRPVQSLSARTRVHFTFLALTDVIKFCNVFDNEANRDVTHTTRKIKIFIMRILNQLCHALGGGGECLF